MEQESREMKSVPGHGSSAPLRPRVNRRLLIVLVAIAALFVVLLPLNLSLLARARRDAKEADTLAASRHSAAPPSPTNASPVSLEQAAETASRSPNDPAALLALADALDSHGRPLDAAAEVRQAIKLAPRNGSAHRRLGEIYLGLGYSDLALDELAESSKLSPTDPQAAILSAYSLGRLGRFRQALAALEAAESANPGSAALKVVRSATLAAMADQARARQAAEEAVRLAPEDPQALSNLATIYLSLGRSRDASGLLAKASAKEPSNASYRILLGRALCAVSDRKEEGMKILRDLVAAAPESNGASYALAEVLVADRRGADAIPYLEATVRRDPGYKNALLLLGQAYARAGRPEESRRTLEEAKRVDSASSQLTDRRVRAAIHPEDNANRLALARIYMARKEYGNALYELKSLQRDGASLSSLKPMMLDALMLSGRVVEHEELRSGKKMEDSRVTYAGSADAGNAMVRAMAAEQANVKKNPRDAKAWLRLGTVLGRSGDLPSSIGALSRAATLAPQNPLIWKTLAHASGLAGRKAEEIEALENWRRIAPGDPDMLLRLADAYLNAGWVAESYPIAEDAVKAAPASYAAHSLLGRVQYYRGEPQQAIAEMEKAGKLGAPADEVDPQIAGAYFVMAHYAEARALLERYMSRNADDVKALSLHGACLEKDPSVDPSVIANDYRRMIALAPQSSEGYFRLGVLLRRQRQWKEAAENLETALRLNAEDSDSMKALSAVDMQLGKTTEAKALISRFGVIETRKRELQRLQTRMAVQPRDPAVRIELGKLYLRLGRSEDAVAELRHALRMAPGDRGAHVALAEAERRRVAVPRSTGDRLEAILPDPAQSHLTQALR
jgi:tetratricopeptide (TPR) repeat protein